jgi:hypothetical protein
MKRSLRFVFALVLAALPVVGCTPVSDGFTQGVSDGLSAATSAFIEELATSIVSGIVPEGGM